MTAAFEPTGARVHPGEVILVMDHSVITLREGGRPDGEERAHLSLYDIKYSAETGGGHVLLLRVPSAGVDGVYAETIELGERTQARLRGIGMTDAMLDRPPIPLLDIRRDPFVANGFGYRFSAEGVVVEARWDDCEPPFYAEGPSPAFSPREDIWSVFVAARRASIVINGNDVGGAPWDEDVWKPRLPRAMSSAHSALGETRLRPHPARVPG
jgi:hypothetical protein